MDVRDHFRVIARAVDNYSTYSPAKKARTISVPDLKAVLQPHFSNLTSELPPIEEMLEEGARRGFWEMDIDKEFETDIVVLR